jgi:hypothetical protein
VIDLGGDTDSTAALVGGIAGATLGMQARVLRRFLWQLAPDLVCACFARMRIWFALALRCVGT